MLEYIKFGDGSQTTKLKSLLNVPHNYMVYIVKWMVTKFIASLHIFRKKDDLKGGGCCSEETKRATRFYTSSCMIFI